jgi:hypothetical protein
MKKSPQPSPPRSRRSKRRVAAAAGIATQRPKQLAENLDFAWRMRGSLPETITSHHLEILNAGLRFFFTDLRSALAEFGDNQRHGAVIALGALMRFIALFEGPIAERLDVPVLALRGALFGLDDKIVEPLLRPVAGPGRSRSSIAREALKGQVAATVQRLLQTGVAVVDARERVAEELGKLGVRPERGSGDVTDNTVRHWCDEVDADTGRRGAAAIIYDSMFTSEEIERFTALPSNQARQDLALASLTAFIREFVSGRGLKKPS